MLLLFGVAFLLVFLFNLLTGRTGNKLDLITIPIAMLLLYALKQWLDMPT
jgi:hypothetical protein